MGVEINEVWSGNIRFANNVLSITVDVDYLQQLVNSVEEHSTSMGLNINNWKTKFHYHLQKL